MRILLCPDKFKGSLSAAEVCEALKAGLLASLPHAQIISRPLADGGDGSLEVLSNYIDIEWVDVSTIDPLWRPIHARYGKRGNQAFIEVSAASGLVLLEPAERSAIHTSTVGTGRVLAHAIDHGAKEIFLFLGGSATNDAGTGIAEALGYRFYDKEGNQLIPTGGSLVHINRIEKEALIFDPVELAVHLICDVDNPFFGPNGAAYVYGPQKGASNAEVELLDAGLQNLAKRLVEFHFPDVQSIPGSGAAGGIGGGGVAFLNGDIRSGTQTFLELSQMEAQIQQADLIITGEGYLDHQTVQGKLISGVAELAHKYQIPLIGVCGSAEKEAALQLGMEKIYTIIERSYSLEEAMTKGAEKLREIGLEIGKKYLSQISSNL